MVEEQGGFRRKRREESAETSSWHWYILQGQMKAGQEGGWLPAVSYYRLRKRKKKANDRVDQGKLWGSLKRME